MLKSVLGSVCNWYICKGKEVRKILALKRTLTIFFKNIREFHKITNNQKFRNQSIASNNIQEVNLDNSDEDAEENSSNDYDCHINTQLMADFQKKTKEMLKK